MKTSIITTWDEDEKTGEPKNVQDIELYPTSIRHNFINDLLCCNVLDGAILKFNEQTESFYIDVNEKGGLYFQILEKAKSATKDLSDFKAYIIVAEDYIKRSTLKFIPIPIQTSLENAEREMYTRYLVKNKRYFRSELNQRKARGESVTSEDEEKAVIPDFNEVKPSKNVLEDCKELIKNK